jgi:Na+-transporting methylmalonyl-CoA/oxaloacetate decarboxylase gamma subunit
MDNFTFGMTILVCGMGGTLATLALMSFVMTLLGRLFPPKQEQGGDQGAESAKGRS